MSELSKGNKGALSEYRVACSLMAMSWLVYRCMVPNATADLIIVRRGQILKVQVKSGINGGQYKNLRQGNNDLLAVVTPDNEIIYKAKNKRIARLFPVCLLARPPKKRHKRAA
jgi:hypothetical protein